jgi:hypothetical protein
VISRLNSLKNGQLWLDAATELDEAFQKLIGTGTDGVATLGETELLARIIAGESTLAVREKTLVLVRMLKEAGDVEAGRGDDEKNRMAYLKGLHLLLHSVATGDLEDWPEFVPTVESLLLCLGDSPLPQATLAMLMQHYEMAGDYARAEDMLFAMAQSGPVDDTVRSFGETFYERLRGLTDDVLVRGRLPRAELDAGLAEWRELPAG